MISNYKEDDKINDINNDKFKRIVLLVLISLTVIQQMPLIKDLFYSPIRLLLYMGFGLFSIASLLNISEFAKISLVKYFIFTITYSFMLLLITKIFDLESSGLSELIIPFGILMCSLNTDFDKKQLSKLLIWYVILSVITGISSVFYYGKGFVITEQYFLTGKNQVGPLLGISTIITGLWMFKENQFNLKYNNALIKIFILIALISSILTIRNRASIVGIIIVLFLALIKEFKFKLTLRNIIIILFTGIVLILAYMGGGFDGVVDMVVGSLFSNYDSTSMNSLSAGRTDVYKMALEFAGRNPVLGELAVGKVFFSTPHNYILNKWVKYGVIGSLPLVLFYLYLWIFVIKEIKGRKEKYSLPIWVLLFSLIVSLFEYTYPYGPGASQVMLWLLLGQYLKQTV